MLLLLSTIRFYLDTNARPNTLRWIYCGCNKSVTAPVSVATVVTARKESISRGFAQIKTVHVLLYNLPINRPAKDNVPIEKIEIENMAKNYHF